MTHYVGGIVPSKIKIRMLAKVKLEGISRQIDNCDEYILQETPYERVIK